MKEEKIKGEDFSLPEETEIVKKARKRVGFKIHITIYLLSCVLVWLFWFFFQESGSQNKTILTIPLFITLVWGISVIVHYLIVYKWDKTYLEKEVKRLKKQQGKQQQQIEDYSNQDKL
jgi:TRAP-type C4-dicarboxylate transport system permease small subunit